MLTTNTQFEHELKKRIGEEIERLASNLVIGTSIQDYAQYQHVVGQVAAYQRVATEFCDDANTELDKR
jgi:hypothetical protein